MELEWYLLASDQEGKELGRDFDGTERALRRLARRSLAAPGCVFSIWTVSPPCGSVVACRLMELKEGRLDLYEAWADVAGADTAVLSNHRGELRLRPLLRCLVKGTGGEVVEAGTEGAGQGAEWSVCPDWSALEWDQLVAHDGSG